MARQNPVWYSRHLFVGRKRSAPRLRWDYDMIGEHGFLVHISPAPGRTYTRDTWPPRGRGRGESLTSPRRIEAKLRTVEVIRLRTAGHTWQQIASALGFRDASGPYRAMKRALDRIDWERQQQRR